MKALPALPQKDNPPIPRTTICNVAIEVYHWPRNFDPVTLLLRFLSLNIHFLHSHQSTTISTKLWNQRIFQATTPYHLLYVRIQIIFPLHYNSIFQTRVPKLYMKHTLILHQPPAQPKKVKVDAVGSCRRAARTLIYSIAR